MVKKARTESSPEEILPEERQDGTLVTVTNATSANFEVNYPMHLGFPVGAPVTAPWGAVKQLVTDGHLKEVTK
jgi:hypothetical protein